MANSRTKSTASHLCPCRNPPPLTSPSQPSSAATHSSSSRSYSSAASFFSRAPSPTCVSMYNRHSLQNNLQSSSPVRLSVDRTASPARSLSMRRQSAVANQKRTCACSPTTHPGSFRCALHKASVRNSRKDSRGGGAQSAPYYSGSRLNFRRSAMANSIVRIGGVEGDLVKRALSALIRPSSHNLRRRSAFEPRPSRLSAVTVAEAECEES